MSESSGPASGESGGDPRPPRAGSPLPSPDDAVGTLLRVKEIPWMEVPHRICDTLATKLDVQEEWKLLADKLQLRPDLIQAIPYRRAAFNNGSCTLLMFSEYLTFPNNSVGEVRDSLIEMERYDCAKILDAEVPALVQRAAGLSRKAHKTKRNGLADHPRHYTTVQDATVGSSVRSPGNSPAVALVPTRLTAMHAGLRPGLPPGLPPLMPASPLHGMPHIMYQGHYAMHLGAGQQLGENEDAVSQVSTAANYDVQSVDRVALGPGDPRADPRAGPPQRVHEYPADVDVTIYRGTSRDLADEDIPVGAVEEVVAKSPSLPSSAPSPAHSHERLSVPSGPLEAKRKLPGGKPTDSPRKVRRESPHLSNSPRTSPQFFLPPRPNHSPIGLSARWDPPLDRPFPSPYTTIDTHNKNEMVASWIASTPPPNVPPPAPQAESHPPPPRPPPPETASRAGVKAEAIYVGNDRVRYCTRPGEWRTSSLPVESSASVSPEASGEFTSNIPSLGTESSLGVQTASTAPIACPQHPADMDGLASKMDEMGLCGTFPRTSKPGSLTNAASYPFDRHSKLSQSVPPNAKPGKYTKAPRNTVFITYSHDSREHMKSVLHLATNLKQNGFGVAMDEKVGNLIPESETKEVHKIRYQKADYVVVCVSPQYRQDYESVEIYEEEETRFPGRQGHGTYNLHAKYIYRLMYQDLTHHIRSNRQFVVVLMSGGNHTDIPHWLRNSSVYEWPGDYNNLNYYLSDPEKQLTKFLANKRTKHRIVEKDPKAMSW